MSAIKTGLAVAVPLALVVTGAALFLGWLVFSGQVNAGQP